MDGRHDGFAFVDGGRTFSCRVEVSRRAPAEAWWRFEVSTVSYERHAPFRAAGTDTRRVARPGGPVRGGPAVEAARERAEAALAHEAAEAARVVAAQARRDAELAREEAAQSRRAVEEQAAVIREMQDTLRALLSAEAAGRPPA